MNTRRDRVRSPPAVAVMLMIAFPMIAAGEGRTLGQLERSSKLMGQEVQDGANQRLGKLQDLVVDLESGRALYAVISLRASQRQVAVPVSSLAGSRKRMITQIDGKHINNAPQFSNGSGERQEMLSTSFASKVYKHFGQRAWWEDESGRAGRGFGNAHKATDLKGMDVRNTANQKIGEVEDLVVDLTNGRVPLVVLAPDNSLDLKGNLYAMPPSALTSGRDQNILISNLDRAALAAAPHFNRDRWPDFSKTPWASRVYQHFGEEPYFESTLLRATSDRTNSQERLYHEPAKQGKSRE